MIPSRFNGKEARVTIRNGKMIAQIGSYRLKTELRTVKHVDDYELRVNEDITLSTEYLCQLYMELAIGAYIKMSSEYISIGNAPDIVRCRINGNSSQLILKAYSIICGAEILYFDQITDVRVLPPYRLSFRSTAKWEIVFENGRDLQHIERFLKAYHSNFDAPAENSQTGTASRQLSGPRDWFLKTLSAYLAESAIEPVKRRLVRQASSNSGSDDEFGDLSFYNTECKPKTSRRSFPYEVASDVLERAEAALAEDLGYRYYEECKPQLDAFKAYFGKIDQDLISRSIIKYVESVFRACAAVSTSSSATEDSLEASAGSCEPSSSSSLIEAEQPSSSTAKTLKTKAMCPPVMRFASGGEEGQTKRKKQVDVTYFI